MATKPKELPNVEVILGTPPSEAELTRLAYYFPSYNREHRTGILSGFFFEKSVDAILQRKFAVFGVDSNSLSPQSLNSHKGWAHTRIRWTLVRILYTRYRLDQGLDHKSARTRLHKFHTTKIFGKEISRKYLNQITNSPVKWPE